MYYMLWMARYSALSDYLRAQKRNNVPMTFNQIERLIGRKLPASHRYRSWWSNNSFNSVMTKAWLDAGFESANVDMKKQSLVFRKIEGNKKMRDAADIAKRAAVSKRHPMFGALKGLICVVPGTDLTEPADPEWGSNA
jgi:hypothetical protein